MSRINILNATAEDFKLEVFASAPSNGSTGDHADGRIVKYGTHLYMWHDASGVWVQFGNASDVSSLETRLSQQEAECDSDVSSLESKDSSLETRISSEEIARASAVSSANTRAVAAEGSLETRLSAEEVARANDVNAEESRALLAEGSVELRLSIEESARVVAVDSLETRAEAAELSLTNRISAEESAEAAAEGSLNTRMAAEESVRLAKDGSLETAIAGAGSSRASADSSLETRLSTEEDRVDAILNASSADKDSFAEIVSFINSVDVAHDSQTSTEISSIDSAIASAESARIADDSSLETRLSVEESVEAAAEGSLNTRMAAEESVEASAEASLDARMSSEESARLAADNSLATSISDAASARASGDSSLTTRVSSEESARAAGDSSLETVLNAAILSKGNEDSSLTTRLSNEESARAAAVSSEASSRVAADSSLEVRLSTEESQRAFNISVHEAAISSEASSRLAADNSLETRLSSEESAEAAQDASLETRLSNEEDAMASGDSSVETRFSNEVSTEKSRVDAILDSAAADKDTFAELVSFITAVDTESDDALASYVTSIDSSIASEASSEASAESSLNTVLYAADSVRKEAIDSLEASHSALISAQGSSIAVVEADEAARHLRIDFTNQTTFSVAAADLPAGFTAGNGMVQIFHEVSSGTYRHLVAPASYNASTGAMSFDLGSTAKDGFAVFYSFAGDETAVTEVASHAQFKITGAELTSINSSATVITFDVSGISAANADSYLSYTRDTLKITANYQTSADNLEGSEGDFTATFSSAYDELVINMPNANTNAPAIGYRTYSFYWGETTSYQNYMAFDLRFDNSTNALKTDHGLGKYLADNSEFIFSPPYVAGSGTASYSSSYAWNSSSNGQAWTIDMSDIMYQASSNGEVRNYKSGDTSSSVSGYGGEQTSTGLYPVMTWTTYGSDYYGIIEATKLNVLKTDHWLYSEVTSSRSSFAPSRIMANVDGTNGKLVLGYFNYGSANYNVPPTANSTITFYLFAPKSSFAITNTIPNQQSHQTGSNVDKNWQADPTNGSDIKIVIDTSDQSYQVYRNSNVGGTPSWTTVERMYLSNQDLS